MKIKYFIYTCSACVLTAPVASAGLPERLPQVRATKIVENQQALDNSQVVTPVLLHGSLGGPTQLIGSAANARDLLPLISTNQAFALPDFDDAEVSQSSSTKLENDAPVDLTRPEPFTSSQPVAQNKTPYLPESRAANHKVNAATTTVAQATGLSIPVLIPLTQQPNRYQPSITSLTPSAYGKSWGNGSVGFGFQPAQRFSGDPDAVFGVSVGFGNANKVVGLDVGYTSVSTFRRAPFTAGTFSFKLHRRLPNNFAIAVGVNSLIEYGFNDSQISPYGVVTKLVRLEDNVKQPLSRLYISAGLGAGQFRSELNVARDKDSVNPFGSVAVRVIEPLNVITEWTGQDLTVGLSFVPFRQIPLVVSPAVTDITGNAGSGTRFVLGVGYGFSF